jgi:murein L,D-transpeptidase YafK
MEHDLFDQTRMPPVVSVCNGRYAFSPGSAAMVGSAVEERCPPEIGANTK